jgi:glyoxylase-like metal-dependent hydrolase (beta-lactamase superfamily II)
LRKTAIAFTLTVLAFAWASEPDGAGLEPGQLPASWLTCGPNAVSVPDWQVHEYNDNFYILRESGCINYEKPFLYLIFGDQKALLEDTGAGQVNTGPFVEGLLAKWAKKTGHAPVQLMVVHSHNHGDHTAGDKQIQTMPEIEFIAPSVAAIQKAANITNWPTDPGTIDLGGRVLDVLGIPGHQDASIAIYDRKTGIFLTGDTLYPGRLYVSDFPAYMASAQRMADFVKTHPIAHVLGTHIEQSATPYLDYPIRTTYQPNEHSLAMTRANVLELNEAVQSMKDKPEKLALPDFTVQPQAPRQPKGNQKKN